MPPYIAREAYKLWKRIVMELMLELKILSEKWKLLLLAIIFQYVHGIAAKVAHYLHQPGRILPDIGFRFLPELGRERAYISETLFTFVFVTFFLWTFHPFVFHNKRFYTVLVWYRVLATLVVAQCLRIMSFLSTSLPGPNYHCHEGSPSATLAPPKSISEVVFLNFPYGVIFGCGDLIFSSHMIFTLVFIWTYQKYGTKRWIKRLAWLVSVVLSLLIIASRKHYTVDVVVAWYTVALVFYFVDRQLSDSDISERSSGPLLPLRGKDSRSKEEMHKLMNGVSTGDATDWRQRTQDTSVDSLANGNAV
ncbi:hypothetical protein SELMODRAFT_167618 [Selaginella moellendorffii]|uniref:Sphingomyelin synthase-like domain-containing protein n=1 Tax=Selaginella moellendorffii TaxID=88036 RepID=D8R3B9_SELML|nr:phosphatidylinositol:ceramide inositolphosphotransferase [Selaginella moellendorffii]EFJ33249.1 hypothetical protein SELMODRAFT_167618 [Selaginella moellendorffii]|eukprot:XP_002965829.1 phosphatidylinositol:ceramide inositolphosphotransferase [Selaginella moellendorffii]